MWNLANVWEPISAAIPDRPALIRGGRTINYREFDRSEEHTSELQSLV